MSKYADLFDDGQRNQVDPKAPASAARPYADLFEENPKPNMMLGVGANPDKEAEKQRLAKRYSIPPDLVDQFHEDYANKARLDDADKAMENAPALRSWIAGDAARARIAHDDVDNLSAIERVWKEGAFLGRALASGLPAAVGGVAGMVEGISQAKEDITASVRQSARDMGRFLTAAAVGANAGPMAMAGFAPEPDIRPTGPQPATATDTIKAFRKGAEQVTEDVAGPLPADAGVIRRGVRSGIQSIGQQAPGIAASIVTGNPAFALLSAGVTTGGQSTAKALDAGLSGTSALAFGAIDGVIEVATEKIPVAKLLGDLKAGSSFMKTIMHQMVAEIPGEQVATLAQDFNEWATLHPEKPFSAYAAERPAAAVETLIATIVGTGAQTGAAHALTRAADKLAGDPTKAAAEKAKADAQALTELDKLAQESKVRERSPADWQSFMQEVAQSGPVKDVYIDARDLDEAALRKLVEASPAAAQQAAESLASGVDMQIPAAEFGANVFGQGFAQSIIPHLKTDPNGMSLTQAEEAGKTTAQDTERTVADALGRAGEEDAAATSRATVEADVLRQLNETGRFTEAVNKPNAALWAARYATLGARLGITPEEAYKRFPATITATPPTGAALEQSGADITPGSNSLAHGSTTIDYSVSKDGKRVEVSMVKTPAEDRGKGQARAAMERLLRAADASGAQVVLTAEAMDKDTSKAKLEAFYKSLGFRANKGRSKDFTTMAGMVREPRTGALAQQDGPVGSAGPQSPEARGLYTPAAKNVALLERANFSSFLHESGHLFLDQTAEIASLADAPADIKADMDTLLEWFGIKAEEGASAIEVWNRMTLDQQREHHEKLARGFEAFAWEGKAPSVALAGAFQRFRGWLRNLYRSLTNLNVTLTDEVRAVMSRMVATDEEIAQAKAAQSMGMMFDQAAAEKLGIDYRAYQAQDRDATDEAASELDKRRLGDLKWYENAKSQALRELQRDAADKRREVKAEARSIVMSRPVYRAWAFLTSKSGEAVVPGVTPVLQADETELAGKLRTSALKEMFGDAENAVWRKLEKLRMTKEAGGMHPDVAAELFGYDSGEAMVDALRMAQTPSEAVEAQTDAMMLERYGDITSQEALERAATEAVHNKARTRVIATELTALEKAAKVAKKTVNDAARAFAAQVVGRQKVGDLRPEKFEAAARKAAMASLKSFKEGDIQKAATEKRNELINTYAARAAREAQRKTQSILKYFKRIDTDGARKNRRGEFVEQRDALLARFDLRTSLTRAQIDAKTPLADWVKAESERLSAVKPDLPGWVLDETSRTHYKELTVDDFVALKDSVEQLDNLAKREQKQYMAIRRQSFDEEKGALLDKLRSTQPQAFDSAGVPLGVQPDFVPSIGKGLEKMGDKFVAEFLSVENIIGVLEGKTQGAVWESLFGRISRQSDAKAERLGKIFKQMKPLFDQYSYAEKVMFSRKDIGTLNGIGIPMTRENALVTALLNGNKEGRDRLANYGWSPQTIQSIVDMLDPKDIKLAEGIWTMFDESLWPELKALNDRTKGASPPKVEAMKFNAKGGELRGGYFPLRYNTDLYERAQRYDESQSVADMLGGSALGMSAKTRQGTSQARIEGVKMRPRLDLQVFSEVVNETVHDIAYREAVADTMRMLNNTDVQNALKVAAGVQSYRAMVTLVRETAAPPRNPSGFIEKTLSIARKNTIVTLMSGVKTALQNFTGLFPAMAKVGPGILSREFGKFFSPKMLERTRFAMDQSAYLRGRFDHYDRDLQSEASRLTVNGKIMPDTAYFLGLMGLVDRAVTVPVWNAAFAEGMAIHGNDQARAVDYADSVVRTTQGSGRDVDLAKIQSGHGGYGQLKRVFTMFYSYFSGQLGLLVQTGAVAKQEAKTNPSAAVAKFTAKFVAIVVIPTVLTEVLMNGPGGSDDEDNQAKRWAKVFGRYGAALFPVVRDFYSYAVSKFDPDAKFHGASFRLSPVEAAFEGVGVGIKSGVELADGGGDIKDAKGVIMGLGFLLGLPGKLVSDTVAGTNAWLDGTAGPEAVVLGPPKAK